MNENNPLTIILHSVSQLNVREQQDKVSELFLLHCERRRLAAVRRPHRDRDLLKVLEDVAEDARRRHGLPAWTLEHVAARCGVDEVSFGLTVFRVLSFKWG